jgi:hypothetical protein
MAGGRRGSRAWSRANGAAQPHPALPKRSWEPPPNGQQRRALPYQADGARATASSPNRAPHGQEADALRRSSLVRRRHLVGAPAGSRSAAIARVSRHPPDDAVDQAAFVGWGRLDLVGHRRPGGSEVQRLVWLGTGLGGVDSHAQREAPVPHVITLLTLDGRRIKEIAASLPPRRTTRTSAISSGRRRSRSHGRLWHPSVASIGTSRSAPGGSCSPASSTHTPAGSMPGGCRASPLADPCRAGRDAVVRPVRLAAPAGKSGRRAPWRAPVVRTSPAGETKEVPTP